MSDVEGTPTPPHSPTEQGSNSEPPAPSTNVPPWVRTFVVVGMFLLFGAHVSYDAVTQDYAEFNTSLLLIGFVGLALGYDVMGRR